jgi:glycosyltransferase involved in cell wall biosynthesis
MTPKETPVTENIPSSAAPAVLHVVDHMGEGGAQQVVVGLANWTSTRRGMDVSVFGAAGPAADRLAPEVAFVENTARGFIGQTVALFRVARRLHPSLFHAHQRREALQALIVGRLLRIPVVEHAHTRLPSVRPRFLSFRSRVIFAVGPTVADMVVDDARRPRDRVVVVGNAPAQRTDKPSEPREPGPELRLLAIGRLVDQKDPFRFVRVVARLAESVPVRAVWAGDGELRHAAEELAADLHAPIDFVGRVDDIVERIDSADCVVLSSRWEGTPLALLEAFDRERVVVATRSAANGLLDGGRGFAVEDAASDREFAHTIAAAFDDAELRRMTTRRAKQWVSTEADPDRVFGTVATTYESLVGGGRSDAAESAAAPGVTR